MTEPDIPAAEPPSAETTLVQLADIAKKLAARQEEMDGSSDSSATMSAKLQEYERKLKPWRKLWALIVALGVVAAFVFGVGVSYQQFMGGNATKTDVETGITDHVKEDLVPVKKDVKKIKEDMVPVKSGVEALVTEQKALRTLKKTKRKLDRYNKQHTASLEDYAADKAAHRPSGPRPQKSKDHIDLEEQVEELEDKL